MTTTTYPDYAKKTFEMIREYTRLSYLTDAELYDLYTEWSQSNFGAE